MNTTFVQSSEDVARQTKATAAFHAKLSIAFAQVGRTEESAKAAKVAQRVSEHAKKLATNLES